MSGGFASAFASAFTHDVVPPVGSSSSIENAIMGYLGSDLELLGLMPNGIYYGLAPARMTRYVSVAIESSEDVPAFGRRAQQALRLRVVAVALSTAVPDLHVMDAAARRIDLLLEDVAIPVAGFTWGTIHRLERIRETDRDFGNPDLSWYLRGGIYRVVYAVGSR